MANQAITISESRFLPAAIGGVSAVMAVITVISDINIWARLAMFVAFGLAAIWSIYRACFPRWVIRIVEDKLHYQNLSSKQEIEFDITEITETGVHRTWFTDCNGMGFQDVLVLQTNDKTWTLRLPFLSVKRKKLEELISERFAGKRQATARN